MAFLGVERSAKEFTWVERPADPNLIQRLRAESAVDELRAQLLASRGITPEALDAFMRPRLRDLLPDPSDLKGFHEFESAFFSAHQAGERIGILADYDVDGATSAAVLVAFLRALGLSFELYVPDRLNEGYGPSDEAFDHFTRLGITTVITLDCGSMAHGPLHRAESKGIRVLVIDHHLIDGAPPSVTAHINPNQSGCISGIGTCAAVGVCFTVIIGLRRSARQRDIACELDLMLLLDLVALGTVCDVVPLKGLNRAFVLQGLKVWPQTINPGLRALTDVLPKRPVFDGSLAGFQIGPRLNAAGRIGPSDMAARILTRKDEKEAKRLAQELDRLNQQRRDIESQVLSEARLALRDQSQDSPINLVVNPSWHPGVVGIVAGRLKDSTGKPSIVLGGQAGEEALSGSGRSVPGFDLGAAVLSLRGQGLLLSGGGHAMAAGLKLMPNQLEAVREGLARLIARSPSSELSVKKRPIDIAIRPSAATFQLAQFLTSLQPFGSENPEPKVAITDLRVEFMTTVGKNHLKLRLSDGAGSKLSAIAFRAAGTSMEMCFRQGRDQLIHVVGTLAVDDWASGEASQLLVEDVALSGTN